MRRLMWTMSDGGPATHLPAFGGGRWADSG